MKNHSSKFLAIGMAALLLLPGTMAHAVSQNGGLEAIAAAASGNEQTMSDQLAAPERYTAALNSPSGAITLTADAELVIPNVNAAPVLGVEKAPITQAQVDVLIKQLVKGELCSAEAYVPSKAQLQHKLDLYQKLLDGGFDDPLAFLRRGKSPAQVIEGEMAQLNVQMDSAGDAPRLMPIQGQLSGFHRPYRYAEGTVQVSQYETGEELDALAYSESAGYETLLINNSDTITNFAIYAREPEDFAQNMGDYSAITKTSDLSGIAPLSLSEEQARQPPKR